MSGRQFVIGEVIQMQALDSLRYMSSRRINLSPWRFGEGGLADDQMLSAAVLGSCTLDICALLGWLAGVVRTDLISQQSAVDYVDSVKKQSN